jgi:hypothetical protein
LIAKEFARIESRLRAAFSFLGLELIKAGMVGGTGDTEIEP